MSTRKYKNVKSDWFDLIYAVLYQLILLLGKSVLLGGFELGDEVLSVSGVDKKFTEWRSDGHFILYDRH